jgi:hypothetical protein
MSTKANLKMVFKTVKDLSLARKGDGATQVSGNRVK